MHGIGQRVSGDKIARLKIFTLFALSMLTHEIRASELGELQDTSSARPSSTAPLVPAHRRPLSIRTCLVQAAAQLAGPSRPVSSAGPSRTA
jgi:hypothetical protein